MGDRRTLVMALVRFVLALLIGTVSSRWYLDGGWVQRLLPSALPAAAVALFLWVMDVRDLRKQAGRKP